MKIKALAILLCCMLVTSCDLNIGDFFKPKTYNPQEIASDDHPFAVETMEEIIRCLDEDDSEALKELLSQEVLDRAETENEIEEVMKVYDGQSVSHDDIQNEIGSSSARDGQYTKKSIYVTTKNLVTDTDFQCTVNLLYVLVDDDADKIGIYSISIRKADGVEMCAVNSLHWSRDE